MSEPTPVQRFRLPHAVIAGVLCAVHVALVHHFMPFAWLTSRTPISGVDFDTHVEQTWRVIEGLRGWGRSWVYDVQLLAGFPNGTIFDADNKLWELWTYFWSLFGVPLSIGFNSYVFLAHLLILPWSYATARVLGLGIGTSLLALGLSSMLWLFDSYAHWFWWIGTVAYIFAAYFYLLPLALFYRFTQDRKLWRIPVVAVLLTIGHLNHPYIFFVLVVPMVVLWAGIFRSLSRREHLAIVGIAVVTIAANAYWLIVAIEHWHYILNSAFYGQSQPGFIFADFFNLLIDAHTTGYIGTRAGFRWLCLAAALVTLYYWRRERDPRYRMIASGFAFMFALAYVVPAVLPAARQIQPYRFVASAMFLSVFPAAALATRLWERRREIGTAARAALCVLAIPAFQHLASDVAYYFPEALPKVPKLKEAPFPLAAMGYAEQFGYRHLHPSKVDLELARWVDARADEGRVAVPDWTGERLAWATRAQVLGGFVELNMDHARAHLARWVDGRRPTASELHEYLVTYAVRYVIVHFDDWGLPNHPQLLEPVATIGPAMIYRSKLPVSFFFENHGTVVAKTNRIEVRDSDPMRDVILKYHWHEALKCRPRCRVERADHPRDEVGFIRVRAPHPPAFTIENSYQMD